MKLLERDAELAAMSQRWRRARARAGSFLLVGGEAGIGKTQLVRAFAEEAVEHGRVAWGACDPLHTPRPLGPLHDAARELLGDGVAELLAQGGFAHEVAQAVFEELAATPTALVVEDVHWVDGGTLDVLRSLLRRVSATRSGRGRHIPRRRARRGAPAAWTARGLRPYTGCDVGRAEAAEHRRDGGDVGERPLDARRLHALTGGNPFFLAEVLGQEGEDLPRTVREAVLARTAAWATTRATSSTSWPALRRRCCRRSASGCASCARSTRRG